MANVNRNFLNRKKRLRRRRREVARFIEKCAASNLAATERGEPKKDFTQVIRDFKESRK
jgi:hypothetical protein